MIRNIWLVIMIVSLCLEIKAQTGPGGVGKTDGTSSLVLWIQTSDLVGAEGSLVTTLTDKSGYGNHFTSGTGATLTKLSSNGLASLEFNGTSNYFERPYTTTLSVSEFTVFTVTRVSSVVNNNYKTVISNSNDPAGAETQGYSLAAAPNSDSSPNQWQFSTGTLSSNWDVMQTNFTTQGLWATQMCTYKSGTNGKQSRVQGTLFQSTSTLNQNSSQPVRIGAGRNHTLPGDFFSGLVGEIIVYNTALSSTEITVVTNYLAAKYGAVLIVGDAYTMDDASNGNYDYDVAALSRSVSGGIVNDAKGTGIIRVNNPNSLDASDNFYWGHDDGIQEATNYSDVPAGVISRFNRVWRVSEAGDVGTTDMLVDLSSFIKKNASHVVLLIDRDADGLFADETDAGGGVYMGASDLGSSVFAFTNINIANGQRFTFGTIDISNTPLPLVVLGFKGKVEKTYVLLEWKTSDEDGLDHFNIEHSTNGLDWKLLETEHIKAESTAAFTNMYNATHQLPARGHNYYKLISVDVDGTSHYYKTIDVFVEGNVIIDVYPNPARDYVKIVTQGDKIYSIALQDALGNIKWHSLVNQDEMKFPVDTFDNGIYILRVLTKNGTLECKKLTINLSGAH